MPGAVEKKTYVAIAPNGTNTVNVFANQFNESYSFSLDITEPHQGWMNYLLGVTYHIQHRGKKIGRVDLLIDGDIPVGAGMSSSAALVLCLWFALERTVSTWASAVWTWPLSVKKPNIRLLVLKCGIMDQFASLHGKKGHVMKLDCRSLEYEYIPFDFPDL